MNPPPDHPFVRLTLTPPGPITSQVTVEIRGAVHNPTRSALSLEMRLELPDDATGARASVTVPAGQARRLTARINSPKPGKSRSTTSAMASGV
ncbi:MAG: hypothetical protein HUU04_11425, partial [Verrucomicrobiae bacterium]|nr:hypothetical protein [Verrucomicrobiae bacterium]